VNAYLGMKMTTLTATSYPAFHCEACARLARLCKQHEHDQLEADHHARAYAWLLELNLCIELGSD
jgi:hypothetical protein